jgi:WD40 repeat protein
MFGQSNQPFAEFGDHTQEVTQVSFSKAGTGVRAFSASLDKTFRVYDIAAKCTLKTIQAPSPINKMAIDLAEC